MRSCRSQLAQHAARRRARRSTAAAAGSQSNLDGDGWEADGAEASQSLMPSSAAKRQRGMQAQRGAAGNGRTLDSHSGGGTSSGIGTQNRAAGQAETSAHPAAAALWCEQQVQQVTWPPSPTTGASTASTSSPGTLGMHAALLRQLASILDQQAVPVPPPAGSAARLEAASAAAHQASRLPPTSAVLATWRAAAQQPRHRGTKGHSGLAAITSHSGTSASAAGAGWLLQPQQQMLNCLCKKVWPYRAREEPPPLLFFV